MNEATVPTKPKSPPIKKAVGMLDISAITPKANGPSTWPALREVVNAPLAAPIPKTRPLSVLIAMADARATELNEPMHIVRMENITE